MADIELVIKISEALKNDFETGQRMALSCMEMKNALEKATVLPKGHGRLIDAGALPLNAIDDANHGSNYIKIAPTIIEADKEYEAEVITRGKCMMCGKELTEGLFFCKECGDKANSGK